MYVCMYGHILTRTRRRVLALSHGCVYEFDKRHQTEQVVNVLENGMRLAFKCHQFAGGLDKECASLFHQVRSRLEAAQTNS